MTRIVPAFHRLISLLAVVPLLLGFVVAVQLSPPAAGEAQAAPPECNTPWRPDDREYIGGKTSGWIKTRKNGWSENYIQFKDLFGRGYSRYVWNGKTCKRQMKWDKSADRYRTKGCLKDVGCAVSPWTTWRTPYGFKVKFLGKNYAYDVVAGIYRWGW